MRLLTIFLLRIAGFQRSRVRVESGARGGRGSSYEYWVLPPVGTAAVEEAGEEKGEAAEESAAPPEAPLAAAAAHLLHGRTTALSRFGRRLRRRRSSRSLTPADSASSLEEELELLSVDLEGEGGGTREEGAAAALDTDDESDDPSSSPSTAPILFLHGVGLGITPYLLFVAALRKRFPRRPLLLMEARHVSVGLVPTRAASTCDVASAALEAMRLNRWESAAVVAHSYGTFVAARLLAAKPQAVQSLVLLDPVCALTIYPQLLANFVYKPPVALLGRGSADSRSRSGYFWPKQEEEPLPTTASSSSSSSPSPSPSPSRLAAAASAASSAAAAARALLTAVDSARFLFSRDLTVGEAFCRRFAWHRECLWPQDLRHSGKSTLFGLAGGDDLVPSALVKRALAVANSRAVVSGNEDPRAGHGGFLLDRQWQGRLLDGAEVVIEAGAAEERAEKEARRRSERGDKGEEGTAAAAPALAALEKATAAAAFAAAKKLLDYDAPDTPARPATADIGDRKPRRSFSRQQVVPVVL